MSHSSNAEAPQQEAIEQGHEPDTVDSRLLVYWGLGLIVLVAMSLLVMAGLLAWFRSNSTGTSSRVTRNSSFPELETEVSPYQSRQLRELRESAEKRLNSYGWIDKKQGIAHIPIKRAMEIVAEEGFKADTNSSSEEKNVDESN